MTSMIKISEASSIALHAMVILASHIDSLIPVRELAETLGFSEAHLAKVLQRLAKHGIVKSVRGPGGGFRLGKPADQISLLDVYETIDGQMGSSDCLYEDRICNNRVCIMGNLLGSVSEEIREHFAGKKLSELAQQGLKN